MVSIVVVSYNARPNPTKRMVERFMVRDLERLDGLADVAIRVSVRSCTVIDAHVRWWV